MQPLSGPSAASEVECDRAFYVGLGHLHRTSLVTRDRLQNVTDIRRIAGAQLRAAFAQAEFAEELGRVGFDRDALGLRDAVEDLIEDRRVAGLNVYFVVDTTKKRLVSEIGGVEVRREHNHQFERDLELNSISQCEIV